jgi:two-component system, OmpR family, sensor kinase
MSIRLRLALWYGALFAAILALVGVLTYALHTRGHYDDRDRLLVTSAAHAVAGVTSPADELHAAGAGAAAEVVLQLFDRAGRLRETSEHGLAVPSLSPAAVLRDPAGPAFDPLAGLAAGAPVEVPAGSTFGLIAAPEERWRAYVLPVGDASEPAGYVVALTPLGGLDAAIASFRLSLLSIGLVGLAAALVGGWAIGGRALGPVDRMTRTAGTIAQARDVSHRVEVPATRDELGRLAETFNLMLASLEQAARAQQRFVADASHELRTPLTAIQGNLEILERQPDMAPGDRDELLGDVRREAARLARLVADLLALARADAGIPIRRAQVELDTVVLETFQAARPLAQGQTLTLDPFEPALVVGDEDRLRQLVLIVVDNAMKYTPAGGRVTLGLRACESNAEIVVADTGVGIAPGDLPHIFERFFRSDPARSRDAAGTGLGLAIGRWIAEQHGGTIDVQSSPGAGTTVTVRLPLAHEHVDHPEAQPTLS